MTVNEPIEPWLARDQRKLAFYRDDPYFWEGWAAFAGASSGRPAQEALRNLTFLLVKPEAIAGRRIAPILEFLRAGGYRIIGTWPVRMGRHEARCLWRYQLNVVPLAHIRALQMVVAAGDLFLLGIDRRPDDSGASAAELLSRSKGSSGDPIGAAGGSLRDLLGRPAVMLNFVHAPDEPADVLRELAVLCDGQRLERVVTSLLAATRWPAARFDAAARAAAATMTSWYARSPAHDLDAVATLERMRAYLRDGRAAGLAPAARTAIERGAASPGCALEIVAALERAADLPEWDRIVTAVHFVDGLRTGRPALIGPPPISPPLCGEPLRAPHEREQRHRV